MIKMNWPLGTTGEALFYFIEPNKDFQGKSIGLYYQVYRSYPFSHNLKTWGLVEYIGKPEEHTSYFSCNCLTISISLLRLECTWLT